MKKIIWKAVPPCLLHVYCRWVEEFIALAALPTSHFVSNNPLHSEQVAWHRHSVTNKARFFWLQVFIKYVAMAKKKDDREPYAMIHHVRVHNGELFFSKHLITTLNLNKTSTSKTPPKRQEKVIRHLTLFSLQGGVHLPILRPVTLYMTEKYRPERPEDVLVPEPREACVLYCLLRAFKPATFACNKYGRCKNWDDMLGHD